MVAFVVMLSKVLLKNFPQTCCPVVGLQLSDRERLRCADLPGGTRGSFDD